MSRLSTVVAQSIPVHPLDHAVVTFGFLVYSLYIFYDEGLHLIMFSEWHLFPWEREEHRSLPGGFAYGLNEA